MRLSSQNIRQNLFAQFAQVADALAHGHRLALLELLAQGERDVETLAGLLSLSMASTSQHLQRLKRAGLVVDQRDGRRRIYRLVGDDVSALVLSLEKLAEFSLASVEKLVREHIRSQDDQPPVAAEDLVEMLRREAVVLLDVRPPEEYTAAHLPGAINMPLEKLKRSTSKLPKDREVVVYCRGVYCTQAMEAVQTLRHAGFQVRRLEESVPEWRRAGLPVEDNTEPAQ